MEKVKYYHKNPMMVARKVEEELMLVPIKQNVCDLQCMYIVNKAGTRVWELLDGEIGLDEIASILVEEYEVEIERVKADVINYLAKLESIGAITLD